MPDEALTIFGHSKRKTDHLQVSSDGDGAIDRRRSRLPDQQRRIDLKYESLSNPRRFVSSEHTHSHPRDP